jgi:hypothetical protein
LKITTYIPQTCKSGILEEVHHNLLWVAGGSTRHEAYGSWLESNSLTRNQIVGEAVFVTTYFVKPQASVAFDAALKRLKAELHRLGEVSVMIERDGEVTFG